MDWGMGEEYVRRMRMRSRGSKSYDAPRVSESERASRARTAYRARLRREKAVWA